ncbi:MAG: hypothetical protein EZS28_047585, partial [Streblomastix strix]
SELELLEQSVMKENNCDDLDLILEDKDNE